MSNSAVDVAKFIITYCNLNSLSISNLKLQKILYYVQHEILIRDNPVSPEAFVDDFQAWKYGPVVPSVYNRFSMYGGSNIDEIHDVILDENLDTELIKEVVKSKVNLNPWKLVDDTHEPGKAWDKVYRNGKGAFDIIPKKYIKDYV